MNGKILNKEYWNDLYKSNEIGWDLGYPSPPIKEYIDQLKNKNLSILIPGCGNSYEAEYLLQSGFANITLIDIAPLLTHVLEEKLKHYTKQELRIITGDFFLHKGKYDLILEQTFLSALEPSLRPQYVNKMHYLLKPEGKLVGLLFSKNFDENPPFGGDEKEYIELFSKQFDIKTLAPCYNSIERRAGSEVFINMSPK